MTTQNRPPTPSNPARAGRAGHDPRSQQARGNQVSQSATGTAKTGAAVPATTASATAKTGTAAVGTAAKAPAAGSSGEGSAGSQTGAKQKTHRIDIDAETLARLEALRHIEPFRFDLRDVVQELSKVDPRQFKARAIQAMTDANK